MSIKYLHVFVLVHFKDHFEMTSTDYFSVLDTECILHIFHKDHGYKIRPRQVL